MSVLSVYAVFANADEAERIGRTVVEERLAACVNLLGPIRSIYRWKGAIETAEEAAAIFKTHHWRSDALIERIAELHSYDVPCIVSWPIEKLVGSYANWIEDSLIRDR
jgi:periplasmic divalent cation tolerance protein